MTHSITTEIHNIKLQHLWMPSENVGDDEDELHTVRCHQLRAKMTKTLLA
jgi:hypothetical protein